MAETRTIARRQQVAVNDSYFGSFDVPETASNYRVLVAHTGEGVAIALLNWGTSAEFPSIPTGMTQRYSVAEHLTNGNLVDAENLIGILRTIVGRGEL